MRTLTLALIVVLGAITWACGGSSDSAGSASADAAPASSNASDLVDKAIIDSCAGFNVAKAAGMLGVPEAELEVRQSYSERFGGQQCRYWSKNSNIGPGIDILLNIQESSAAARRILEGQREVAPVVDVLPERGPAVLMFDGIGDEAFWDSHTGGVNVRVRNIIATIHASLSNNATSDRDPAQLEMERRVAEEVARALSS
jgi:hypothetical protein